MDAVDADTDERGRRTGRTSDYIIISFSTLCDRLAYVLMM